MAKMWLFHAWTTIEVFFLMVYCLMIFIYARILEMLILMGKKFDAKKKKAIVEEPAIQVN